VANIEQLHCNKTEYRPWLRELEGFLDRIYMFHPQVKHKTLDYDRLQGFADEVLKLMKKGDQDKKTEDPKGDFPKAHKEINYIYGGFDSYESRTK
jgi:hypothetical protein